MRNQRIQKLAIVWKVTPSIELTTIVASDTRCSLARRGDPDAVMRSAARGWRVMPATRINWPCLSSLRVEAAFEANCTSNGCISVSGQSRLFPVARITDERSKTGSHLPMGYYPNEVADRVSPLRDVRSFIRLTQQNLVISSSGKRLESYW